MSDELDLTSMVNDASFRRLWLLRKAMESAPLDRAIDLARMAEEFIAGSRQQAPLPSPSVVGAANGSPPRLEVRITKRGRVPFSEPRPGLGLSADKRDRLLDRLVDGARNAELATEFGISPRQVQGVRMGSAREIAERRKAVPNGTALGSDHSHEQLTPNGTALRHSHEQRAPNGTLLRSDHSHEQAAPNGTPLRSDQSHLHVAANGTPLRSDHSHEQAAPNGTPPRCDRSQVQATPDDIVRYLRQQDDIVVPEGAGAFLVNGRFRLELPELVSRANKMRGRQGKPEFRLTSESPNQNRARPATRHPIFWEQGSGSDQIARAN